MAAVVLLPLVPVTQATRLRSTLSIHSPRPPTTGTPDVVETSCLGSVAADAGCLEHDVATLQLGQPTLIGGENLEPRARRLVRMVVDQHGAGSESVEPPEIGPAFDAEAPHPDRRGA